MNANNKPIVVPWDFSKLSIYALEHAVLLAKTLEEDIILAHIVKRKSDIDKSIEKMKKVTDEHKKKYGIKPKIDVRAGSIFSVISEIINESNATFAVMGTHGVKGMQKFTGSWALKVIVGSNAPFIVVQEPPITNKKLNNIVFPIDFKFSAKEKLIWANFISRKFSAKFHLCYINITDPSLKRKTFSNINISKKYLSENMVDYEIVKLEGSNVTEEAVKYSKKIDADLIMISTTRNISFQDYVLGASEQKIIVNKEKIPVMCINPRKGITRTGGVTG